MLLSKKSSIQKKVTILFVSVVIICAVGFGILTTRTLSSLSNEQLSSTKMLLQNAVLNSMTDAGKLSSERISKLLEKSFAPVFILAKTLVETASTNEPLSRDLVSKLNQFALEATPTISAIYSQCEPNGYDGVDAQFIGNDDHSSSTDTMEIYWSNEGGESVFYPTEDAKDKYDNTKDENGIRAGEFY